MSEHEEHHNAVPPTEKLPHTPSGKTQSAYARGRYPFTPAMEFKEIARALGISVTQTQTEFYRGMTKLGFSLRLRQLWEEAEASRSERNRHFATPYARTIRVAVVDAPAHELQSEATL